jgi:hypothetical protein
MVTLRRALALAAISLLGGGACATLIGLEDHGLAEDSGDGAPDASIGDAPPPGDASLDAAAVDVLGGPNRIFVTSRVFDGGNLGGRDGADKACQDLAGSAGLEGTWIAYLSTSAESAAQRVGSARGWIRTDGRPVADLAQDLDQGRLWYPVRLDEHGKPVGEPGEVATGADPSGGTTPRTCADWTTSDAGGLLVSGSWGATTPAFEANFYSGCTQAFHLYCLEASRSVRVAVPPASGRIAFVASVGLDTSIGLVGADSLCASLATDAGLPGPADGGRPYRALLATSTVVPVSRFDLTGSPWIQPDGVQVVESSANLADANLLAPILVTQNGTRLSGGLVWEGSLSPNKAGGFDCDNWTTTDASSVGYVGFAGDIGPQQGFWQGAQVNCSTFGYVYCLQN